MGAQTAARLAVICSEMVEHLPDLTIGEEEAEQFDEHHFQCRYINSLFLVQT